MPADGGPPGIPFLGRLVTCAARVLARCGDGDLHFVGRSADSVYDLLSGALSGTSWRDRIHLFPYSHRLEPALQPHEVRQLRANLTALGVTPYHLARRKRPIAFTDLVSSGWTFSNLYDALRAWIGDMRDPWRVIRLKLRFLGITERRKTSRKTWRCWHADALAEAVAIAAHGRTPEVRAALVRRIAAEPAFGEPWLRSLAHELRP